MTSLFGHDMSKAVVIPECSKNISGLQEEISISPTEKKDGTIGLFSRFLRLDSLKRSSTPESPITTEPPCTYYGVYIPCEIKKGPDEEALHVYKNKVEALELVRRYKLARFKAFHNRHDAVSFALRGAEPVDAHDGNDNSVVGEKPYPFKAPSPQDMVSLRKAIEAGLTATVSERVWDNPRFLVSSGNTPAILQEGSRYNALHVAAKSMNAEICNLILTTVGNPAFVQSLYGSDADPESCKEFASILVDRYLNTPDKAMNETPLHFAAKFGAAEAVDVITSFPQCNKHAVNKYGEQPKHVICKRAANASPELVSRIEVMLQERYYVPVLHTEDGSGAPTIGTPFTPAQPPTMNADPLSPRYEIRAFAGPMQATDAASFRRRWKTPPRAHALSALSAHSPLSAHSALSPRAHTSFRLKDFTKGLENVGRELAEEMKIGWKEYWPFLDTFTDLRTPEGLTLLETYLKNKYDSACSLAYNDSCANSQLPDESMLSRISLLKVTQNSPLKDTLSPMSELCVALNSFSISSEINQEMKIENNNSNRQRITRRITRRLPVAEPVSYNGESQLTNHTVSRLLCIERTCQVFAKRIADALIFSLNAEPEVAGDSLKSEAKHLHRTMLTYMDDDRFRSIDFTRVHSRLAQLVVFKLKQITSDLDDVDRSVEFLMKLRCPNDDIFSSDDERKPVHCICVNKVNLTHVMEAHVRCLASFICEELTENDPMKGPSVSENECSNIWQKALKCRCDWRVETLERNSKTNASFRKNRSTIFTSALNENFVRRLSFDHEIGDGKLQNNVTDSVVSVNSPAGDSGPEFFTVNTDKCQVLVAEISEDESCESCQSESEDAYLTASEYEDDNDMTEASDRAVAETFIYGEEPTKMDRLAYDAICHCRIEPTVFPNVYRWRHTIALYTPDEREAWVDSTDFPASCSVGPIPDRSSTPKRDRHSVPRASHTSLQVSNWLRVTGPNSPRSILATKNVNHNVSFGF